MVGGPRNGDHDVCVRTLVLRSAQVIPVFAVLGAAGPIEGQSRPQEITYHIEATLDEDRQVLRGRARFIYKNHSSVTIDRLFFHQHLNAFRPNSAWARAERREALDFQSLTDPDYGYERLLAVRSLPAGAGGSDIVGRDLTASYPGSPDSTVVEIALPDVLEPGEAITLELQWEARPSTLCRRQCRRDRHYDFAQWYPRIAPFDAGGWAAHALYPQGEFYGEFATYDVTLDLAEDQVVGATGAVVDGDPGWGVEVPALPEGLTPGAAPRLGFLSLTPAPGRKRVRFYAEDVHHFAWTASPEYVHEGGQVAATEVRPRPIDIHVLYRPGDEEEWGSGAAVERTVWALEWLESTFGPYPWPQLTNVHRLEGGGTEFPMMIMDGSASQGLIMHETAHQYVHGILANNEWKEAWLDEGFASFLTTWALSGVDLFPGPGDGNVSDPAQLVWREQRDAMAEIEAAGFSRPISTVSEDFPSFSLYGYMAYSRGGFFFRMLSAVSRGDENFRRILRTYYDRHRLGHVTEQSLRSVAEDVVGQDLGWFFDQWLHTTGTLDYAIDDLSVEETEDGWLIRVAIVRTGDVWMPTYVALIQDGEISWVEMLKRGRRQTFEMTPAELPDEIVIDPLGWTLDSNAANDRRAIVSPDG